MSQHRGGSLVLAICLVTGSLEPLFAQTPVSESELLVQLEEDEFTRALLEAPVAEARAEHQTTGRLSSPSVAASREEVGDAEEEWMWSVRWTPPLPGQRSRLRAQASAQIDAAQHRSELDQLERRLVLREAFAAWAVASARVQVTTTLADEITTLERFTSARAEAGEAAGIAARRLDLDRRRARSEEARYRAEARRSRGRLEALVGPLAEDAEPILPALPSISPDSATQAPHPVLQLHALEEQSDILALELARRNLPAPELQVGWKELRAEGASLDGPVFGLSWRLPLSGERNASMARAQAARDAGQARRWQQERELLQQRQAALSTFETLREAAQEAPSGDAQLRHAVILSYRLGETSLPELLGTLGSLHDSALEHLDLLDAALQAHRDLEYTLGHPLEITP